MKPKSYLVLFIIFQFIGISNLQAQEEDKEKPLIKIDEFFGDLFKHHPNDSAAVSDTLPKLTKKQKKALKIKEGKPLITPYIAPVYSPELEFAISGGALVTFSTNRKDTILKRSSVPIAFTISSNGSKLLTSYWTTFFNSNRVLLNGIFQYRDLADQYYGVGYQNGFDTPSPDSTYYTRKYWQLYGNPMWLTKNNIYVGFIADFNFTGAENINAHMTRDPDYLKYGANNRNTGVGAAVSYDTRDFPQNAYSGSLVQFGLSYYSDIFGGQNKYVVSSLQVRKYISVSKTKVGRIIAINFNSRYSFGGIPYGELSYSGSPYDIRGYRILRFRDMICNNIVVEYRHKFDGKSLFGKKSGFVVWVGAGSIGPDLGNSFFAYVLPTIGVGYRFEVEHRLNVRVDFGVGLHSTGTYFNFQEAY